MASSVRTPSPRTAQADTFWARLSPTTRHAACLEILLVVALAYAPYVLLAFVYTLRNPSLLWASVWGGISSSVTS